MTSTELILEKLFRTDYLVRFSTASFKLIVNSLTISFWPIQCDLFSLARKNQIRGLNLDGEWMAAESRSISRGELMSSPEPAQGSYLDSSGLDISVNKGIYLVAKFLPNLTCLYDRLQSYCFHICDCSNIYWLQPCSSQNSRQ